MTTLLRCVLPHAVPSLAALLVALSLPPLAARAQESSGEDGPLILETRFLGTTGFRYEGGEKQKIVNFWGTSFTPEFQEVIATDPEALAEARKLFMWNKVAFGVAAAGLVWMISDFTSSGDDLASLDAASRRIPSITLLTILGMAAASAVGQSRLKNGVRRFNLNRGRAGSRTGSRAGGWSLPVPAVVPTAHGFALQATFALRR